MNYPGGVRKDRLVSNTNYGNRGMNLEGDLNSSNQYYVDTLKAFIYKKPTPIKIVKVDYACREAARIKEAYFTEPSTTDYNGIYKGKYIDFEAKETKSRTSFSLNNIHPHQIRHLRNIRSQNGIAFLIVRFTTINKTFLLLADDFFSFIDNNKRKSIPIDYFNDKGYILKEKLQPRVDYLEIIDQIYGGILWKKE